MIAMEVGLSLGSNEGDRLVHLSQARKSLQASPGLALLARSPVYETEPVGVPPAFQAQWFLNAVLILKSALPIAGLFELCRELERREGRPARPARNAPRPIDLDIIYAGQLQCRDARLSIPHPRWAVRRFVVRPLCDVRMDLIIPGQSGTVAEVLAKLRDPSRVQRLADEW